MLPTKQRLEPVMCTAMQHGVGTPQGRRALRTQARRERRVLPTAFLERLNDFKSA